MFFIHFSFFSFYSLFKTIFHFKTQLKNRTFRTTTFIRFWINYIIYSFF